MASNSRLQNASTRPYMNGRSWNGNAKKLLRRCQKGGGGGSDSLMRMMALPAAT